MNIKLIFLPTIKIGDHDSKKQFIEQNIHILSKLKLIIFDNVECNEINTILIVVLAAMLL